MAFQHETDTISISDECDANSTDAPVGRWACDPLEHDQPDDERIVTTPRRMLRVAVAAADAGARFTRDRLTTDPAAWLTETRPLFGDRAAMDACQDLEHFRRVTLLNGLALDLETSAPSVDALARGTSEANVFGQPAVQRNGEHGHGGGGRIRLSRRQLLTCWIDVADRNGRLFAFCAVVTDRAADLVERVVARYGPQAAARARYSVGFDHSVPLAAALISDCMADTLALAAGDPDSPPAQGLDVAIEQRFVA